MGEKGDDGFEHSVSDSLQLYKKKRVTVREKNIHLSIDHKFKKHSSHLNIL